MTTKEATKQFEPHEKLALNSALYFYIMNLKKLLNISQEINNTESVVYYKEELEITYALYKKVMGFEYSHKGDCQRGIDTNE